MVCLEKLDVKHFPSPADYQQTLQITNLLVRKAEMVFSSHLAYWSAFQPTHKNIFTHKYHKFLFNWDVVWNVFFLFSLLDQPATCEEEEEVWRLLAALVVCVPGLVPVAVHQWNIHLLHPVVRFWVRQTKVHQVGHVSRPLPLPKHLHTAASQGG